MPDFEMLLAFAQKNCDVQLKEQLVFLDMFAKLLVVVSESTFILTGVGAMMMPMRYCLRGASQH